MFGFNWVDLIIVVLLVVAMIGGIRVGLTTLLFIVVGFFAALFLGGWFFPHVLPIHDRTLLTIINGNLVLIFAVYIAVKGFDLGQHFRYLLGEGKLYTLESRLGVIITISAVLIGVWLIGAALGRLPFAGISNSVNDAYIVRQLDTHLPPVPAVFALFDKQVNPNAQPYVFDASQTNLTGTYNTPPFKLAESHAKSSTVRVTSFGCGGLVSGSGFVVDPEYVVTNAHVVAGVKRPVIKYDNRSYGAITVLFDQNLDFAVLKVKGLPAAPLTLANTNVESGTPVVVLGYPNGNFKLGGGIVRNDIKLFGRNIYDLAVVARQIYEVQTYINTGSSGGPIVLADGRVAGMIFAKSEQNDNYAFALTSTSLIDELNHAERSDQPVNTGVCLAE